MCEQWLSDTDFPEYTQAVINLNAFSKVNQCDKVRSVTPPPLTAIKNCIFQWGRENGLKFVQLMWVHVQCNPIFNSNGTIIKYGLLFFAIFYFFSAMAQAKVAFSS